MSIPAGYIKPAALCIIKAARTFLSCINFTANASGVSGGIIRKSSRMRFSTFKDLHSGFSKALTNSSRPITPIALPSSMTMASSRSFSTKCGTRSTIGVSAVHVKTPTVIKSRTSSGKPDSSVIRTSAPSPGLDVRVLRARLTGRQRKLLHVRLRSG